MPDINPVADLDWVRISSIHFHGVPPAGLNKQGGGPYRAAFVGSWLLIETVDGGGKATGIDVFPARRVDQVTLVLNPDTERGTASASSSTAGAQPTG